MQQIKDLNTIELNDRANVLICFPHPDDESAFCAGIIQRMVKRGCNVRILSFTRGEKSLLRMNVTQTQELGDVRQQEIKKAAKRLGVSNVRSLDLPDGEIRSHLEILKEVLSRELSEFVPNLVITYEKGGITGHKDHVALSNIITSMQKKYYFNILYATTNNTVTLEDGDLALTENNERIRMPIEPTHKMSLTVLEIFMKVFAILAHKSQLKGILAGARNGCMSSLLTEYFVLKKPNED